MHESDIARVNRERLEEWAAILAANNSTAAFLVGVGQGANAGEVHTCQPENVTNAEIDKLLSHIIRASEGGTEE